MSASVHLECSYVAYSAQFSHCPFSLITLSSCFVFVVVFALLLLLLLLLVVVLLLLLYVDDLREGKKVWQLD